ncbi:MAG: bifunctional 4-hydroxy-3-methylbut-2-enyl diphosphate reductase/30S ribosomal protein S1, partial [Firmicutes bacterium]|nr:bifunctional 4-hydroxy-3-methylbut-2-enyl diphosphate reductase/30S ribosomal protein S1 [Bacillota bacterium]
MSIRLAEYAGFCSGVRQAVERALQESSRGARVSTLGSLVHNEAVAEHLARHGVAAVESPGEAAEGILLIRTHGVAPAVLEEVERRKDLAIMDLTCPKVRRLQKLVGGLAESGIQIIIYGDSRHPEVKGVIGWAGGEAEIDIVSTVEELKELTIKPSAALVAQTTGQSARYREIGECFQQRCPTGKVY